MSEYDWRVWHEALIAAKEYPEDLEELEAETIAMIPELAKLVSMAISGMGVPSISDEQVEAMNRIQRTLEDSGAL